MAKSKKKTQQTLESTLGRTRIAPPTKTPKRSTGSASALQQSKLPTSPAPAPAPAHRSSPTASSSRSTTTRSALRQSKITSLGSSSRASPSNAKSSSPLKNAAASGSSPARAYFMSSQVDNTGAGNSPFRNRAAATKRKYVQDDSSSDAEAEEGGYRPDEREEEEWQVGQEKKVMTEVPDADEEEDNEDEEDEEDEINVKEESEDSADEQEKVLIGGKKNGIEKDEEDESDESDDDMPVPTPSARKKRPLQSDSNDDDDQPVISSPVKRRRVVPVQDDSDEDEHDQPVKLSPVKRRRVVVPIKQDSDADEDVLIRGLGKRNGASSPIAIKSEDSGGEAPVRRLVRRNAPSSPVIEKDSSDEDAPGRRLVRRTKKKPLTAKERARELLRRKRAGEVIEEEDEEEGTEEEEVRKGLYDTDSDNIALDEFEDDDEEPPMPLEEDKKEERKKKKKKKGKKKEAKKRESGDEGSHAEEEDLEDFVIDDSDEPLGAPDELLHDIPIEFTRASHKPLKEHFRDVVEWLVHFKINPGFADKTHAVYSLAWRKLDDEIRGLADSKFASSSWRPDFYKALRARPYFTNNQLVRGEVDETRYCGACGRSGHTARYSIQFHGAPYYKSFGPDFLNPIEPDSDEEAEEDEDEDGNPIPKESKVWYIGTVCNDNAEIAHTLIHWKNSLLDWVDSRLMSDQWMTPERLAERARWKPKKLYKLVDEIVGGWVSQGVVKSLWGDFGKQLETARSQSTSGRRRWG